MRAVLTHLGERLVTRDSGGGEIALISRRIFVLPTAAGVLFGGVLLLMLLGSVNYDLALGLGLTFLLASLGITALLHTGRNLARLRVVPARTSPVFAGETAQFTLVLRNPDALVRHGIGVTRGAGDPQYVDVPAAGAVLARLAVPTERRGRLRPGRVTLFTRFPLGLFRAWAYVEVDACCIVYPKPAPPGLPLPAPRPHREDGLSHGDAPDDFVGLREYQPGDSPRRVAWKAIARGHVLLTKQFAGGGAGELWLTLEVLPRSQDIEDRLSQLARWVLDAHVQGLAWGLALPGRRLAIGTGAIHRDRCLEALALYQSEPPAPRPDLPTGSER
jgi:uncharacterized protein (DUF58 family)